MDDQVLLQKKLEELQSRLRRMEEEEMPEITKRRIAADMGDDYRENEGAKMVMEQHDIWYIRKVNLKKEMANLKTSIFKAKTGLDKV